MLELLDQVIEETDLDEAASEAEEILATGTEEVEFVSVCRACYCRA